MTRSFGLALSLLALACGPSGDDDGVIPCEAGLVAGDLVITEVFADADGADEGKEWFEIYNTGAAAVELEGVVLVASKTTGEDEVTHVMGSQIIEAGAYMVVGGMADELKPDYVDYGYGDDLRVGSSRGLPNADGRLALKCDVVFVDEVEWSVMTSGASQGLDGTRTPDYQLNDDPMFWCDASTEFATDSLGTPGAMNDACSTVAPTMCDDGGTTREVVRPEVGDVVITEVLAAPDSTGNGGPGGDGEWFEIQVTRDVDLNGLQIGQAEADSGPKEVDQTLTDVTCLRFTAGSHVVFVASTDTSLNGGIDADFPLDVGLTNSDDGVFIGWGDEILDVRTWSSSPGGTSENLDVDNIDPDLNDEDRFWCDSEVEYGDKGQLGSPGEENVSCGFIPPPDGECYISGGSGATRAIDKPTAGEVIVNEWMVSPNGTDTVKEYAEIKALASFDINGLQLGSADPAGGADPADQRLDPTNCTTVNDGDLLLFVASLVQMDNGGIDPANITDELMFGLPDGANGGGIWVGVDDTPLDTITWMDGDITPDKSMQVDPANMSVTCLPPDNLTYGTGGGVDDMNFGTPGAVNVCE